MHLLDARYCAAKTSLFLSLCALLLYFWPHSTSSTLQPDILTQHSSNQISLPCPPIRKHKLNFNKSLFSPLESKLSLCQKGFMSPGNLSKVPLHHFKNKRARLEEKALSSVEQADVQMLRFRSVNSDIKHKHGIRIALIAKYNKCAGICLGDTVTP